MNAQVAMRVGQLLCGTSLRRAALLPPHSQPMVPEFARPFRSTTVQMGRRAAKIAGRKVRISLGCTGCVAARLAPTLKAPHPSGLHSSRGLALTLCCPAYADVFRAKQMPRRPKSTAGLARRSFSCKLCSLLSYCRPYPCRVCTRLKCQQSLSIVMGCLFHCHGPQKSRPATRC